MGTREFLPPARYDVPFKGSITWTFHARAELNRVCGNSELTGRIAGCARPYGPGRCSIAIDEVYRGRPRELALIKRHEIGHCNGWGAAHER